MNIKFHTSWFQHIGYQSFLQGDTIIWAWSNILNILKVTSFQYLYNISIKKLGMEFIFSMQRNTMQFLQVGIIFLMEVAIVPKVGSLQYNEKRELWLLLFSIMMKNIQIFYGGSIMCIVMSLLAQPTDCRNFLPEHCNIYNN